MSESPENVTEQKHLFINSLSEKFQRNVLIPMNDGSLPREERGRGAGYQTGEVLRRPWKRG